LRNLTPSIKIIILPVQQTSVVNAISHYLYVLQINSLL